MIPSEERAEDTSKFGDAEPADPGRTQPAHVRQRAAKRVLIVDDALIMRKRIRQIAERAGWEVAGEAADGEEAVALYRRENPDLVTLDIVMPKMDGVEALKAVMAADPDARVVMVSAVDQREKLAECIQTGAVDFIVKPFDVARLESVFDRYFTADP